MRNMIVFFLLMLVASGAKSQAVITGYMSDPRGYDAKPKGASDHGITHAGGFEYIQLMATEDIDFSKTPLSVIVSKTSAASVAPKGGWAVDGSARTYKFNLTKGKAEKGTFFYVGGAEKRIAGYSAAYGKSTDISERAKEPENRANWIRTIAYSSSSGDEGVGAKTSDLLYSNSNLAGIAVFAGTKIDATSVPLDAIFYGDPIGRGLISADNLFNEYTQDGFLVPNNDHYKNSVDLKFFSQGTNTFVFPKHPQSSSILNKSTWFKLGGVYDPDTRKWAVPRKLTYRAFLANDNDDPTSLKLSDIEKGEGITRLYRPGQDIEPRANETEPTGNSRIAETTIKISADFPGGNSKVDSIIGNTVYIRPDIRDSRTSWFYWYFSITNTQSDTVHFVLNRNRSLTSLGPSFSEDGGETWQWLQNSGESDRFSFFTKAGKEVRFSIAPPYLQSNFDAFIQKFEGNTYLKMDTLCMTPKGRVTERLILSPMKSSDQPLRKILLTARHHACEMMASNVLEGVIETVLTSKDKAIRDLRDNTEFWIVPFMDKDGVEDGDQGKNRKPFDHNRDYNEKSIYRSIDSLKKQVPVWAKDGLAAAIDVHCPNIREGKYTETIHLPGLENKKMEKKQYNLINLIAKHNKGPLTFSKQKAMVPFGTSWNTARNYRQGKSFHQWASALPNAGLVSTIEVPYGVYEGQVVTPERMKAFGRDVAYAIAEYLSKE